MKKALACYLAILLSPLFLRAQVADNTALVGTVTDPTQSVVVGAKVVGVNQDTKVSYTGTTNSEGYYSIPFVSPGIYDITVEMSGFRKMTATGVVVQINHAVRTDFSVSSRFRGLSRHSLGRYSCSVDRRCTPRRDD